MNLQLIRAVVIHHSGAERSQSFESIRAYHMRPKAEGGKGYEDIGYHYVITEDGTLRHGRKIPRMGAQALGRNADTLGICLVGDNTNPQESWLPAQVETLRRLLSALRMVIPGIIVLRHADAYESHKTECPGISQRALLDLLK